MSAKSCMPMSSYWLSEVAYSSIGPFSSEQWMWTTMRTLPKSPGDAGQSVSCCINMKGTCSWRDMTQWVGVAATYVKVQFIFICGSHPSCHGVCQSDSEVFYQQKETRATETELAFSQSVLCFWLLVLSLSFNNV